MAHVTTQSATKIHGMDANFAAAWQRLSLAENAYLEFLPGPPIPRRHSRFITHTHAMVANGATLLSAEILQPGRKPHGRGEAFEYDLYSSTLTATRPDGAPLFTEKLIAEPWRHPVRRVGVMGKFDVFANVTLVTPQPHAARIFDQVVSCGGFAADCGDENATEEDIARLSLEQGPDPRAGRLITEDEVAYDGAEAYLVGHADRFAPAEGIH